MWISVVQLFLFLPDFSMQKRTFGTVLAVSNIRMVFLARSGLVLPIVCHTMKIIFLLTMGILALVFVVACQIIPKITTKFSFVPTKEKFNHFPELQDLPFT